MLPPFKIKKTLPQKHMNNLFLFVLICTISVPVFAEDKGTLPSELINQLQQPYPDCGTIAENAEKYAREFYNSGRLDSACMVLEKCNKLCYLNIVDKNLYLLFRILADSFSDSLIDSAFFTNAIIYAHMKEHPKFYRSEIYDFITHLADSLVTITDSTTTDHLIALFVAGKFKKFYHLLRNEPCFRNSKLRILYDNTVEKIQEPDPTELLVLFSSDPYPSLGAIVGMWLPMGNLGIVGQHPELGFSLGKKFWNFSGDLYMTFRLADSKAPYFVGVRDTSYSTNTFSGVHVGVDIGYSLFKKRFLQIDGLVNGGFETFKGLEKDEPANIPDKIIVSYFWGPGLGCRFFIGNSRKLVINPQIWYSFLQYDKSNAGGSNLSGGAISFRVVIQNSVYYEDDDLTRLRYFDK
jgi:hypothetical protein